MLICCSLILVYARDPRHGIPQQLLCDYIKLMYQTEAIKYGRLGHMFMLLNTCAIILKYNGMIKYREQQTLS